MEELRENWTQYVTDEGEDGKKFWELRDAIPDDIFPSAFPVAVVVEWQYAEGGLPDASMLARLHEFEMRIDALNNPGGNSLRAHIIRGKGQSEICHYVRDYDRFMLDFNQALAGAPPYPISIEYFQDPEWGYWTGIRENFT